MAAQQMLQYAKQVYDSAEAGAELAKRMQSVGNFNRIARAREQAFYADAATQLSTAQHQATASREELVRLLGLNERQAQALQLPNGCPISPTSTGSAGGWRTGDPGTPGHSPGTDCVGGCRQGPGAEHGDQLHRYRADRAAQHDI